MRKKKEHQGGISSLFCFLTSEMSVHENIFSSEKGEGGKKTKTSRHMIFLHLQSGMSRWFRTRLLWHWRKAGKKMTRILLECVVQLGIPSLWSTSRILLLAEWSRLNGRIYEDADWSQIHLPSRIRPQELRNSCLTLCRWSKKRIFLKRSLMMVCTISDANALKITASTLARRRWTYWIWLNETLTPASTLVSTAAHEAGGTEGGGSTRR